MNGFTREQVIKKALMILGVIGAGQSVSAEEYETGDVGLRSAVALLSARRVISLEAEYEEQEFPEEIMLPLSRILAYQIAADFGMGGNDLAGIMLTAQDAETDIRAMYDTGRGVQPTPADYF